METKPRNYGSLAGGVILILLGLMALLSQIFRGFDFWGTFWPFIVMGFGSLFFIGMFAGGKSTSGLAIPGSIITGIGLMLFVQNLTGHWESWAYGWAAIIIFVGLGIYIMGAFGGDPEQRRGGAGVMRVGLTLFIIFGAFFEMLFNSSVAAKYIFPAALIGLGLYLIFKRSGLLPAKKSDDKPTDINTL
jgi:hypothetical protein